MSEEHASPAKRSVEDAAEPEAKRVKGDASVQERVDQVCKVLSNTSFPIPFSASLQELLVALAPGALGAEQGQRNSSEEIMLRMLGEIFGVEEEQWTSRSEKAQEGVEKSAERRTESEAAQEEIAKELKEVIESVKEKLAVLPEDFKVVGEAEMKLRVRMEDLLTKQKDTLVAAKTDFFEPLKACSWETELDKEKLLAALKPVLSQNITDGTLLSSSSGALSKKPEERGAFGGAVVQQLEELLDKRLEGLEQQCKSASAAVKVLQDVCEAEEITLEQAEAMLAQGRQREAAELRTMAVEAKNNLDKLKAGVDNPKVAKKNLTKIRKACDKIKRGVWENKKAVLQSLPAAVLKMPAERGGSDDKVIADVEEALTKRLAVLEEQLTEEAIATEAERKQLESDFQVVQQAVETEAEQREGKQSSLTKERDILVEMKKNTFDPLKSGSLTPEALKVCLRGLKKLFKQVEFDDLAGKTLTGILKKSPAERATFDGIMVQQLEDSIDKLVTKAEQQLSSADAVAKHAALKEAVEAVVAAQDALETVQEKQLDRLDEAVSAEKERLRLVQRLEDKQNATKAKVEVEKQAAASQADEQNAFAQFQQAKASLEFLRQRKE